MSTHKSKTHPKHKQCPLHSATKDPAVHWYIVICASAASSITLQAGASDNDNVVFDTWNQGDGQKVFAVPAQYQGCDQIYVQLNLNSDGQTEAAVGYDGWCKKAFHMHHDNEHHDISKDDNDDGAACI